MISDTQQAEEITPGCTLSEDSTQFSFFCPDAKKLFCVIFDNYEDDSGTSIEMEKGLGGFWHLNIDQNLGGKWYGYRAEFTKAKRPKSPYIDRVFADPYSKHVTVRNNYCQQAKSYIFDEQFDWEGTDHCFPDDPRDLIIYETHIKDLTAHSSSGSQQSGAFRKFIEPDQKGGLPYLKKLGVNCVEFLPIQKFAPIEPPFGELTAEGFHNTWNPYEANYWGYMTSFFFAPECSFASDRTHRYSGKTAAAVAEFKEVVRELHKNGITVLMDVVCNHTSLFDINPLTHLLHDYYLRKDQNGNYLNRSGTGNEFKSEAPQAQKLIIDSILYWIEEYKVDGFRFDLAALLDQNTWDLIKEKVHEKYPDAVLIAEPWGGHYSPHKFSDHDWAAWNDRIRNSIKGSHPLHDRGFIFSDWQHETRRGPLENLFKGTLKQYEGGLFNTSKHSVNYLESHDGYTLGDFIRIGLKPEIHDQVVKDLEAHKKLDGHEMALSKLAALTLFTAQGITMIHSGQEFAKTKIIAKTPTDDPHEGKIDHNSYQKNNSTNWLNFDDIDLNRTLYDYYRGLIEIRKASPALRKAKPKEIRIDHNGNPLLVQFQVDGSSTGDIYNYYVVLNGNSYPFENLDLPDGTWELLANHDIASEQSFGVMSDQVDIPAHSGILLRKLRH